MSKPRLCWNDGVHEAVVKCVECRQELCHLCDVALHKAAKTHNRTPIPKPVSAATIIDEDVPPPPPPPDVEEKPVKPVKLASPKASDTKKTASSSEVVSAKQAVSPVASPKASPASPTASAKGSKKPAAASADGGSPSSDKPSKSHQSQEKASHGHERSKSPQPAGGKSGGGSHARHSGDEEPIMVPGGVKKKSAKKKIDKAKIRAQAEAIAAQRKKFVDSDEEREKEQFDDAEEAAAFGEDDEGDSDEAEEAYLEGLKSKKSVKEKEKTKPKEKEKAQDKDAKEEDDEDGKDSKRKKFNWLDQVLEWGIPFKDSMNVASIFMKWGHTQADIDPEILDPNRLINIGIEGPHLQLCIDGVATTYAINNPEKVAQAKADSEAAAARWEALLEQERHAKEAQDDEGGGGGAKSKSKKGKHKNKLQKQPATIFKVDPTLKGKYIEEEVDEEEDAKSKSKKKTRDRSGTEWFDWTEQLQKWSLPVQESKKCAAILEKGGLGKKDIDPVKMSEMRLRDLGISGSNLRMILSGMREYYQASLAYTKAARPLVVPDRVAKRESDDSDDELPPPPYYVE